MKNMNKKHIKKSRKNKYYKNKEAKINCLPNKEKEAPDSSFALIKAFQCLCRF